MSQEGTHASAVFISRCALFCRFCVFCASASYPGTSVTNLAIERGELDGLASWCWTCAKSDKPDWIATKLRVIMQLAENGDPELTQMGVPTVFSNRPKQKPSVRCSALSSAAPRCRDPSLLLPVCRQNALQCCERGSKRPSKTPR